MASSSYAAATARNLSGPRQGSRPSDPQLEWTIVVTTSDDVGALQLLERLDSAVGANSVRLIQPKGRNNFFVSFSNATTYAKALTLIDQCPDLVTEYHAYDKSVRVRVFDYPGVEPWAPLEKALGIYGSITSTSQETYKKYPSTFTGTRIVVLSMDPLNPIPDVLFVAGFRVRCQYPGMITRCYSCHKPGHLSRNCPDRQPSVVLSNEGSNVPILAVPIAKSTTTLPEVAPSTLPEVVTTQAAPATPKLGTTPTETPGKLKKAGKKKRSDRNRTKSAGDPPAMMSQSTTELLVGTKVSDLTPQSPEPLSLAGNVDLVMDFHDYPALLDADDFINELFDATVSRKRTGGEFTQPPAKVLAPTPNTPASSSGSSEKTVS